MIKILANIKVLMENLLSEVVIEGIIVDTKRIDYKEPEIIK